MYSHIDRHAQVCSEWQYVVVASLRSLHLRLLCTERTLVLVVKLGEDAECLTTHIDAADEYESHNEIMIPNSLLETFTESRPEMTSPELRSEKKARQPFTIRPG